MKGEPLPPQPVLFWRPALKGGSDVDNGYDVGVTSDGKVVISEDGQWCIHKADYSFGFEVNCQLIDQYTAQPEINAWGEERATFEETGDYIFDITIDGQMFHVENGQIEPNLPNYQP